MQRQSCGNYGLCCILQERHLLQDNGNRNSHPLEGFGPVMDVSEAGPRTTSRLKRSRAVRALVAGVLAAALPAGVADAATTVRASVGQDGEHGTGWSGEYGGTALSGDGRTVAFVSLAANLVPGDVNDRDEVFVRDLRRGRTTRVSVGNRGGGSGTAGRRRSRRMEGGSPSSLRPARRARAMSTCATPSPGGLRSSA
jgi:hypothetical protein